MRTLAEITQALLNKFKKLKLESQYIIELKEIKQVQTKSIWEFDQRFKDVMGRLTFHIPDQKNKEWFIEVCYLTSIVHLYNKSFIALKFPTYACMALAFLLAQFAKLLRRNSL
jgi:hypothetical protein